MANINTKEEFQWSLIKDMFPRLLIVLGCQFFTNVGGSLYERVLFLTGKIPEYVAYPYIWTCAGFALGAWGIFLYGIYHDRAEDTGEGYE